MPLPVPTATMRSRYLQARLRHFQHLLHRRAPSILKRRPQSFRTASLREIDISHSLTQRKDSLAMYGGLGPVCRLSSSKSFCRRVASFCPLGLALRLRPRISPLCWDGTDGGDVVVAIQQEAKHQARRARLDPAPRLSYSSSRASRNCNALCSSEGAQQCSRHTRRRQQI